jgi:hypothetical protein
MTNATQTSGSNQPEEKKTNNEEEFHNVERALRAIGAITASGLAFVLMYASQARFELQFWAILGTSLLMAGAFLLAGALLGFLFGIPRTLQDQQQIEMQGTRFSQNTNLEQISDWLTKILVGVGLTQLNQVPEALRTYSSEAAIYLGDYPTSPAFALFVLIFYVICGFFIGYLWTRIYLPKAFRLAELAAMRDKVNRLQDQQAKERDALNLVERLLSLRPEEAGVEQEELNKAVSEAPKAVKARIFYRAREVRSQFWRKSEDKSTMARTIPIFEALIKADTENQYHRNHGQLGYALKDKLEPTLEDYRRARDELSTAIELRDKSDVAGFRAYEFNRAVAGIMLLKGDNSLTEEQRNTLKEEIDNDLAEAAKDDDKKAWIEGSKEIQEYRK